ncbi:YadA-like family protein [Pigmentiphaga sp. GD03639]|uniref:YadA-like family protein n=1 Tax=Pigmentiphaga sp. GD03639 TaxID=2975354 RepID=UPI00244C4BA0|nr:YadA-like family protein [Pigmentiphaga sp. GD03639]MDH2236996.1 YadA-like family protein [Pigmentiphaga sp. GD03639]
MVDSPSGGSRLCWDTYPWGLKLNKTYRTVWSQRLGCWVAVAETARARGKGGASKAGALAVALMAGAWAAPAAADGMHGVPGLSNARLTDGAAVGVMSQLLQATTNAAPSVAPVASAVQQGVSQTAAALAGIGAPILPPASALQQVPIAEAVPSLPVVGEVLAATPVPAAVQAIAAAPAAVTKKVGSALPGKAGKAVESVPAKLAEVLASAPVDKSRNAAVPADDAVASAASLGSVATLSNSVPASPMSPLSGNGTLGILPTGGSLFPSSSNRQTMAVAASSGSEPPPLNPPAPTGLVIGTAGLLGGVGQGLQPLTMSLFGQKEAWMRSGALSVNRENINARFSVVNVLGIPILDLAPVTGTLQGTLGGPLPEQKLTLLGGVTSGNYITNINSGLTYNNGLLLPGTQPPSWVDRNNCLNVLGLAGATCWDIPAAQNNQVLIGDGASANGSQEVVIGTNAKHILPNEDAGTIFTDPNMPGVPDTNYAARKGHSVLIGDSTYGNANGQTIVGASASSTVAGGVALGFQSVSDREGGGREVFSNVAVPVRGAVSVGSAGNERQIINVAGGTADTDAVNVRQLKAVADQIDGIDANSVKYDDATRGKVTLAGAGGTVVTNVKAGEVSATSTDAVNGSQLNETNTNVTNVNNRVTNIDNNGTKYFKANSTLAAASASGTDSVAAGGASVASAANAVALGNGANASMANSVALGAGSTTTVGAQSDYVAYALTARQSSAGEVSVGSAGATRRITNVSAGSADTDAANIAQLKAVDGRIGEMDKLAVKYDDDTKSKITLNAGGTSTVISNVGRGAVTSSSTDAINGSQLWGWTQDETNIMSNLSLYKRINDIDSDTKYFKANSTLAGAQATGTNSVAAGPAAVSGGANSVAMGNGATTSADNSVAVGGASAASGTASTAVGSGATATGAQATAMGSGATASGANSTAMGTGSKATGESSTAIGANADASAKNSVALGAGSVADRDNTVSVGAAGKERQITNVARGTQDTDAVNYAQLKEVSGDITNIQEGKDGMFQIENSLARAKPKPTGKDSVAGGAGAMAEGAAATALGNASIAKGENSTAVGNSAQALGVNSTVVGNSALASGANASAFGTGAKAEGSGSMAMGNGAQTGAAATNSVAIGNQANATQSNTVALGNNAQATVANSMALGTGAQASGANSVALGTNSVADRPNVVSVGAAGQERQIANVGDGTADTDAVNLRQLRSATSDFTSSISSVRDDLRRVERNANAGAASAMAVAGLPQAYTPGRSMASAAASHYLGQSAIAVGLSTISENGRWVYKIAGNVNSQGKVGAVIGAGYQW